MANNRINFSVGYTVDKTGLQDLKQSLQEVQKAGQKAASGVSMEAGLKESCKAAQQLESILDDAWNSKLGELNLSDYWDLNGSPNPFGTDTREPQMKATARSLGFTVEDWKAYNDTCLLDPLLDRHPVVVSGIRNDTIGHMWVVDGFLDMTITSYSAIEVGQPAPVTYREIYNHVNWGWDGRSNGYFLSNIFNVGNVYHPDPNVWGATNTSYIYNSELIYFEFYRDLNILN